MLYPLYLSIYYFLYTPSMSRLPPAYSLFFHSFFVVPSKLQFVLLEKWGGFVQCYGNINFYNRYFHYIRILQVLLIPKKPLNTSYLLDYCLYIHLIYIYVKRTVVRLFFIYDKYTYIKVISSFLRV